MIPKYQTITFIFFSTIFLVFCSKSIATENKSAIEEGKNYFFENNLNKSFDILYPIAKKNDKEAQFYIGAILQKKKDYKAALEWFKKSGKNNYSQAYYQIGLMYDNGEGVKPNPLIATDWYRMAQFSENDVAKHAGLTFYTNVNTEERQPISPVDLFYKNKQLAEEGDVELQFQVARQLDFGYFVPKNFQGALKWYKKAAENGHPEAQFQLGYFYCRGIGLKKDKAAANDWLLKAGRQPFCK